MGEDVFLGKPDRLQFSDRAGEGRSLRNDKTEGVKDNSGCGDGIQIKMVRLDSEAKRVSEGPDFMRCTLPGTARRFWAGPLPSTLVSVFRF